MSEALEIILPPAMEYRGGSKVSGTLRVSIEKPKAVNSITVRLFGCSNVEWTEQRPDPNGGAIPITVFHRGNRTHAESSVTVWSNKESPGINGQFRPGEYQYPFSFILPLDIPATFNGVYGNIKYGIAAHIDTPGLFSDEHTSFLFPVVRDVKVQDTKLLRSVRMETQKTLCCWCCTSGPIVLTVALPRQAYCIGETLPVSVTVENGSGRELSAFAVFAQHILYTASMPAVGTNTEKNTIMEEQLGKIESASTLENTCFSSNVLPALLYPTTTDPSAIIEVSYEIAVNVEVPWGLDMLLKVPITIVSMPLQEQSCNIS